MPRLTITLAAILTFILMDRAQAQTNPAAPDSVRPAAEQPDPVAQVGSPDSKSAMPLMPGKTLFAAYGCSLLGTVVPLALATATTAIGDPGHGKDLLVSSLFLGGLAIGPSGGQFYAGSYPKAGWATAIRTAGMAATIYGLTQTTLRCEDCEGEYAGVWIVGGFVTYLGGIIYSMYDSGEAVDRYNTKLREAGAFGWTPTWIPGADGSTRAGAMAWMRF